MRLIQPRLQVKTRFAIQIFYTYSRARLIAYIIEMKVPGIQMMKMKETKRIMQERSYMQND